MAADDSDDFPSVGDAYAAHRFYSLKLLYEHQRIAAERIIRKIHGIAGTAYLDAGRRRSHQAATSLRARPGFEANDFVRAHHTFIIDGRRGSGKTTTLLTLAPFLSAMMFGGNGRALGDEGTVVRELVDMGLHSPPRASTDHRIALVLPVVFTEDMEAQESTMEAVFALMEQELAQREAENEREKEKIGKLRKTLRGEIGVSWTFARKIGAEALSNDALDYDDFVFKRADLNFKSYTKVLTWHRFLDEFLDALGYEVLVLLFDDSDLNPAIAEDIVRAMRMYLSHPRAISVMAVDIEVLRETLVNRNVALIPTMKMLLPQSFSLGGKEDRFARYGIDELDDHLIRIVELEIANTTALLDKVLPRPNRFRLNIDLMEHIDHFFMDLFPSKDAFSQLCRRQYLASHNITWWFLDGPYRHLIAENLRELTAFKVAALEDPATPLEHIIANRVVFDHLQRFVGRSVTALADRIAEAGQSEEGDVSRDEEQLMDLWMDTRIASGALKENDTIPGLRWLSDELDLSSVRSQLVDDYDRLIGLPRVFRKEFLPRNCLYMYQLRRLQPVLEESLPLPSQLVLKLQRFQDEDDLAIFEFELAALSETWTQNQDLIGLCRGLLENLTDPRGLKEGYTEGGSNQAALLVILLVAIADAPGEHRAEHVQIWLKAAGSDAVLARLRRVAKDLAGALTTFERRRQEAILLWSCANDLALLGGHRTRLETRQVSSLLAERATATTDDKPRFTGLVKDSNEHVSRGPRQGLLLAWSLLPLIDTFESFGADYMLADGTPLAGWKELTIVFERALQPFPRGEAVHARHPWLFADMPPETLELVIADVRAGAKRAKRIDKSLGMAGALSINDLWRRDPAYRIAALFGTSEAWVSDNLHVR